MSGLSNKSCIPIIILGDIVTRRSCPVWTLNEKTKSGGLLGREIDHQRCILDPCDTLGLIFGPGFKPETDFNSNIVTAIRDWHWSFEDKPVLVLILTVVLPYNGNLPRRTPTDF